MVGLFAGAIYQAHKYIENAGIFDKNPEGYHHKALKRANSIDGGVFFKNAIKAALEYEHPILEQEFRGQKYKNPIGLAAGFSKEADGLDFLADSFGFGYIVIGGVTGDAQVGNDPPRLFRYTDKGTIINRMGLPGIGVDAIVEKLAKIKSEGRRPSVPVWINLVNSKNTKPEEKPAEFEMLVSKLYPYADVFELNFSCPNQEGVTDIQKGESLENIIKAGQKANEKMALDFGIPKKPMVVKIGPLSSYEEGDDRQEDLSLETLQHIVDVCVRYGIDGIVATNTASEHIGIPENIDQKGGMSGAYLRKNSLKTVKTVKNILGKNSNIEIIGVGGVGTGKNKQEIGESGVDMSKAGANLEQILTGFVMGGTIAAPRILKEALVKHLQLE